MNVDTVIEKYFEEPVKEASLLRWIIYQWAYWLKRLPQGRVLLCLIKFISLTGLESNLMPCFFIVECYILSKWFFHLT